MKDCRGLRRLVALTGMGVLWLLPARSQSLVSVDEAQIRAVLRNGATAVVIPMVNPGDGPVRAELTLTWVRASDQQSETVRRDVVVVPGASAVEAAVPLINASIWTRLRYGLKPERGALGAFRPIEGVVSLAHIADYVFELGANVAGAVRRGGTLTVAAKASHPVSGRAVSPVDWTARLTIDDQVLAPRQTTPQGEGFVDFTFDLPVAKAVANEQANVLVSAKQGDFAQSVRLALHIPARLSGRFQTDKPIYQPGQTLHVRAALFDAEGRAAAGTKAVLRLEDGDGERVHTARVTASRFGVIQDDWIIPEAASLGPYQLTLTAEGDDHYQVASHRVFVSRYELPVFRVTAQPDRSVYLPKEVARVTVTGTYLSGKPVPRGRVKVVRTRTPAWGLTARGADPNDEVVAEGEAGADGNFTADIPLTADHEALRADERQRFEDIHFAAFFTDSQSYRTEPRRFDLRITREPIHVYVLGNATRASLFSPVYVSTSYADGRPAAADVEIQWQGRATRLRTNRYGVGKAELAEGNGHDAAVIRASDGSGRTGQWRQHWSTDTANLGITTEKTLLRAGQAVTLQVISAPNAPAEQAVMIHAIAENRRVASQIVHLTNHRGEVTFPYQPEFRRTVVFAAWDGTDSRAAVSRAVVFPDAADLRLSVSAGRSMYKPAEQASLQVQASSRDGKPLQAALALAVVDQAVFERARTDSDFGRRPWFACAFCPGFEEAEAGGFRLSDLYALPASTAITPELDLVAEALVANMGAFVTSEVSETLSSTPAFFSITSQMRRVGQVLDQHYLKSLEFPADASAWARIVGNNAQTLLDPWGLPYTLEFRVRNENREVTLVSSGPDKRVGTADDFSAETFRKAYFTPIRHLIEQALQQHEDYPASAEELEALLGDHGLLLRSLSDPWGTPYRASVRTRQTSRQIQITSAGSDKTFGTRDDFQIANFSGSYFRRETAEIGRAVANAGSRPKSIEDFHALLDRAGIDVTRYRDAWHRPYRLSSSNSAHYSDRVRIITTQVFGGPAAPKTETTPVTQTFLTFALRSDGPDGIDGTDDDFDVARFPVLVAEESATPRTQDAATAAPERRSGSGTIVGLVVDLSGAVVAGAVAALMDGSDVIRETTTDSQGRFHFPAVASAVYSVRVHAPGFMMYEVSLIPVAAGTTVEISVVLEVGAVAQTVTVSATAPTLSTEAADRADKAPAGTPRVREYFPETLVWLPEVLTDINGRAVQQFPLADSVTTWKVAVFASTLDGRSAEAETEFRSFQPFFLDFQPPPILTEGDQIELPVTVRNYTERPKVMKVALQPNSWSAVEGSSTREITVLSNESRDVIYSVRAKGRADPAVQRIVATGKGDGDAIEKKLRVHPNGLAVTRSVNELLTSNAEFAAHVPQAAIANATGGELRIYPHVASLLLESATGLMSMPRACAEQTISAGYAQLVVLRVLRTQGIFDRAQEQRALAEIRRTVDTLDARRSGDGGLPYWNNGRPDIAVTAYALTFLIEAAAVVTVDQDDLREMVSWLQKAQAKDGRWIPEDKFADTRDRRALLLTSVVTRALAAANKSGIATDGSVLASSYGQLAAAAEQMAEPYLLANLVLAAVDSGDEALAARAVAQLLMAGREEAGGVFWDLQTNSPFCGWGTAGRHETTGVVVSALAAWRAGHTGSAETDVLIRRGLAFLLRGRGYAGYWQSTQATLRAIRAFADASASANVAGAGGAIEIRANQRLVKRIDLPNDHRITDPVRVDLSASLGAGDTQISATATGAVGAALLRLTYSYWVPWEQATPQKSPELRLGVAFERTAAAPGMAVKCSVTAERVGFRGYGMMLAEVGLPPGAEVDRSSLESVLAEGEAGLDHYEILPDRLVLYLWPQAGGSVVDFYLTPRIAMTAQSAPSLLYDYYNPEARVELAPVRWVVK